MSDDLRTGSYKNQIRSRHGEFAKRCGLTAEEKARQMGLSIGACIQVGTMVELAILDGALAELESRS